MQWSLAQVSIPASALFVVLLWLGAFLNDSWRAAEVGNGVGNATIHAGLGRIVFKSLCGKDAADCKARVAEFKRLMLEEKPAADKPAAEKKDAAAAAAAADYDVLTVSLVAEDSLSCALWKCGDADFRHNMMAVLFLGFFSSLALGISVVFVVLDDLRFTRISVIVACVLGLAALAVFAFHKPAHPTILTDNLSFFFPLPGGGSATTFASKAELVKAIELHAGAVKAATEKQNELEFPFGPGFFLAAGAVGLSLVSLVLVLLAKAPAGDEEDAETWTALADDDKQPLLDKDDGSKSPSVISVHSSGRSSRSVGVYDDVVKPEASAPV